MAIATFKDLCIDATDPQTLATFWGRALGLEPRSQASGDAYLNGPTPAHRIWVNKVPEPKTVKHRMHLDVFAGSVEEIERLGAKVLDADSFHWTVMADPEGGEFCVFVRDGEITERLCELVVDTNRDPHDIAAWWAEVLGARLVDDERGFSYVLDIPGAPFDSMDFIPVPEPKTVKNRIHLDVTTDDVQALVSAGATGRRARHDEIEWTVMADPDGNEFCAFVR
jgi:catechol 2,3-dioxygenase-like lactoylglutathione lyase family enzyme